MGGRRRSILEIHGHCLNYGRPGAAIDHHNPATDTERSQDPGQPQPQPQTAVAAGHQDRPAAQVKRGVSVHPVPGKSIPEIVRG